LKPIQEVLKTKETELQQLQHEIDVLRQAIRLLQDDSDILTAGVTVHPGLAKGNQPESIRTPANTVSTEPGRYSDPNDKAVRQFP